MSKTEDKILVSSHSQKIKLFGTLQVAIIDSEDYLKIKNFRWYIASGRVVTWLNNREKSLASFILDIKTDHNIVIDHKNLDILDNQKTNLRIATKSQNQINHSLQSNNTSGYKGVSLNKKSGKWVAKIKYLYRTKYIGSYKTKEEAALAYNDKAIEIYGEFAYLNEVKNEPS